jgi:hypothetical protein
MKFSSIDRGECIAIKIDEVITNLLNLTTLKLNFG